MKPQKKTPKSIIRPPKSKVIARPQQGPAWMTADEAFAKFIEPLLLRLDTITVGLADLKVALERQPQQEKVDLLKQLVDAQVKLTETLILLTAKGVAKPAKEKKVTPADIVENAAAQGHEIAQEQRAATAAAVEKKEKKEETFAGVDRSVAEKPALTVVRGEKRAEELYDWSGTKTGEKPVDPPVVAPAAPPPAKEAAPSLEDLKTLFLDFVAKKGRGDAEALLKSFGAGKISEVPPSQYVRFSEKCRAV